MNRSVDVIFGNPDFPEAPCAVIFAESVEVARLFPRERENAVAFAHRLHDAIVIATATAERMQKIIDHRQSLIPDDIWEESQRAILAGTQITT